MKRFALVALLAAMFFGVATSASAAELKARANMSVYTQFSQNLFDFDGDRSDRDNNVIDQRARLYFDYISNENLKAVVGFEIDTEWGTDVSVGTDVPGIIEVKHAYLDFNFPDTTINVKAGLQPLALPGVFGSPVLDDDSPALVVSTPINDMFAVSAGFVRHLDGDNANQADTREVDISGGDPFNPNIITIPNNGQGNADDEMDFAFLAAPITLDGFALAPYFVYGWIGGDFNAPTAPSNNGDSGNAYWIGANAALTMFDPFTFEADLIYGDSSNDNDAAEMKGWFTAIAASYKMDMVTPQIFFTYASGDNGDATDGSETMPSISEGFAISPYTGARALGGTADSWYGSNDFDGGLGFWSIGLKLLDISFIEKLSHELTIAYMRGTNEYDIDGPFNPPATVFTDEDSAWEVYFVNNYQIYENLAAIVELGYFAPDLQDRIPGAGSTPSDASSFIAAGFNYRF